MDVVWGGEVGGSNGQHDDDVIDLASQLALARSPLNSNHEGIPFVFKGLVDSKSEGYSSHHEAFFYAIFLLSMSPLIGTTLLPNIPTIPD